MVEGYLRRQQMLAKLQAVEIGRLFGGVSTGRTVGRGQTTTASGKRYTEVSADALLLRAGHGLVS